MATSITSSLATEGAPMLTKHGGVNVVSGQVSMGATTISDGVELLLCKIPHRATVYDAWMRTETTDISAQMNLGIDTNEDLFIASASVSTTFFRATLGLPFRVSLTDNVRNQFVFLTATVGSDIESASTSMVVNFGVMYVMDDPSL